MKLTLALMIAIAMAAGMPSAVQAAVLLAMVERNNAAIEACITASGGSWVKYVPRPTP